MTRSTRPARPSAGFTLIEVLLAMAVLLLGVSMLLGLLTFGASLARAAALRGKASTTVEAVMQDLEENLFELLPDGTAGAPRPIEGRPLPGVAGVAYSATATPILSSETAQVGGRLLHREYLVEVELRWSTGGVDRSRSWRTVLLREVPFGERMRRLFLEPPAEKTKPDAPPPPRPEAP